MCGICGVIGTNHVTASASVHRMLFKMNHRGPDAEGKWCNGDIILGHKRLAIIDLSEGGAQPKTDFSGRYTITFNGEIYNYRYLKTLLNSYPFQTQSDTEVILAVYSTYGYETPKYLKGQFAFAIWDNHKRELFLSRDRIGEKPLYYFQDDKKFIFASEMRALVASELFECKINKASLAEYLRYQCVHAPNTLLEGVFQLPAAHYGILKNNHLEISTYWDISASSDFDYSNINLVKYNIKKLLSDAVLSQMICDVPLGAFLSGGIDSSAIVALMAQQSENPVETFSIGFSESIYDESNYATLVAKKFSTKHTRIELNPNEFKNRVPEILSQIDNPSADGPNTFMVSDAVKKAGITVALSGIGGDELFAGYNTFKRFSRLQKLSKLWQIGFPIRYIAQYFQRDKFKEMLKLLDVSLSSQYTLNRRVYLEKQVNELLYKRYPDTFYEKLQTKSFLLSNQPVLSQYSIAEFMSYTSHVLLKDTDQMSMAHSLEVRVPFFDHDLISYVLGIPDNYKNGKYPKSLLVESLGDLLPKEIVHRKKMGFSFPWTEWMQNDLKTFCHDSLTNLSSREILFDSKIIDDYWLKFLKGDPSINWSKIWSLVSLEQWMKNIKY